MRGRSITGPLILVGIGVVFLLNNLGHDIPFWSFISSYWPFLLIGLGVIRLAEVLIQVNQGGPLQAPTGGGGWVAIVVTVCILMAIVQSSNNNFHIGRWRPDNGGISVLGNDFDYNVDVTGSATGATRLILDNVNGDLTVHGGDGSDVKVTGHKSIRAFGRSDADRANTGSQLHLVHEGDSLVLRADEPSHSGMLSISTDVDIVVPRGMNVESRGRGDINVQDMDGTVSVTDSRGDVRLTNIGKDVRVEGAHGGVVHVEGVKGAVDLQGRGSDVQMEHISGLVTVNGEFSGTLEFRSLEKALHFESSHSDFRVEQIPGSVTIDLGNAKIENVVGPVKFRTANRDIDVTDATNALELNVDRGDIEVATSKGPLPKMDLHSRNGDITLTLPDKANFNLDAKTNAGEATNEYGAPLEQRNDGRAATIQGKVGNGPQLSAVTDRGTLAVKKN